MKQIVFFSVFWASIILPASSFSQTTPACDTIYLTNKKKIVAKVVRVGLTEIYYRICDQPNSPRLAIPKPQTTDIRYATGAPPDPSQDTLPDNRSDKVFLTVGDTTWVVQTADGNEYIGVIREQYPDKIVLETTTIGKITILRSNIRFLQPIRSDQIKNGEVWYNSPHTTRYLFGPNGYGLRKGEGYYQNAWVLFNQVSYGVTDNFTLGLGMMPLFLFTGPTPIWFTPKFSLPINQDKVNLGLGGLFATILGEERSAFGVLYGQLTLGSRERNANIGLGYGYAGNSWSNSPTLSFSTLLRAGKKIAFVSENYFLNADGENIFVFSAGLRFIGRRLAIDGALVVPPLGDIGVFIALPWLGINVPLGSKKGTWQKNY